MRILTAQHVTLGIILLVALVVRLLLINSHSHNPNFNIQQDGYADYAHALSAGEITQMGDGFTRLFPGYPFLISVVSIITKSEIVSGLLISLVAALGSIYLFWLLTKSTTATFVFALFPPIWVVQATKVATEPVTVLLLLLALVVYLRQNYFLAGILIGFTFNIRLIAVCLLLALLYHAYRNKSYKAVRDILAGFLLFASILFIYDVVILDSPASHQIVAYSSSARVTIGTVQIVRDFFRAIDWGWYRILISGTLYVLVNIGACILLYRKRNTSPLHTIAFYWLTLSILFIFSLGPNPLLEEFARYTVPAVPALILGLLPGKMQLTTPRQPAKSRLSPGR